MCGITGFIGEGDRDILEQMTKALTHRGPDEDGFFISENVHLGMRRLSIIDVEMGHQPAQNERKNVHVFLNGEIYNFPSLRRDLERKHQFQTRSDTEVIAHLYEEIGEEVFSKFVGMFVIAIWDERERILLLARDRMGEKPLYWTIVGNTLVFGSELKALLQHPAVPQRLNRKALWDYLTLDYIPSPKSIFDGIFKLEPATFLRWKNGRIEKKRYWELSPGRNAFPDHKDPQAAEREFEKLLREAVSRQLISDVPLGIFLSGGIDSSTITYFASQERSSIDTFSIGFDVPTFDESHYAERVAKHLGTNHHNHIFRTKELLDFLPSALEKLDEPFADPSLFPTYLISRFARKSVKVALGGDGGDELLYGYPTFLAHRVAEWWMHIPRLIRERLLKRLVETLPVRDSNWSIEYRLKRFVLGAGEPPHLRDPVWIGSFTEEQKRELFSGDFAHEGTESVFSRHLADVPGIPFLNQISYLYLRTYLSDDILFKTDRASMMHSLEVRAPFLDHRLVEFIFSLPPSLKLKGLTSKWILKRIMKGKLPPDIINRSKKGFGIPVARWLRHDLKELLLGTLSKERVEEESLFRWKVVETLITEHLTGKADHRKPLWTLLMFELWRERWLK